VSQLLRLWFCWLQPFPISVVPSRPNPSYCSRSCSCLRIFVAFGLPVVFHSLVVFSFSMFSDLVLLCLFLVTLLLHCPLLRFVFLLLSPCLDFSSLRPHCSLLLQRQLHMPSVVWAHLPPRSLAIKTVVHALVSHIWWTYMPHLPLLLIRFVFFKLFSCISTLLFQARSSCNLMQTS
jgi:hypothetical protein